MPIDLAKLAKLRPYLYHLTAWQNFNRIWQTQRLESAASLLEAAGHAPLLERRAETLVVSLDGEHVHIRDQAPLHAGNIEFEGGWGMEDLLRDLNSRVFFWPGTATGPIDYGLRHFERYREQRPVVLRIPTTDLLQANPTAMPELCRFNSGSPRCTGGRKSPRGPGTFVDADRADFTVGKVIELTFRDRVALPRATEHGEGPGGPWQSLRTA